MFIFYFQLIYLYFCVLNMHFKKKNYLFNNKFVNLEQLKKKLKNKKEKKKL